jgi:uncharacterized protein (TIGR03067 family)
VLLTGLAPVPPYRPRPDAGKDDLKAMQGVWTERFADSAAVTITSDRMEHTPEVAWKLTLRARESPKRVEATGAGSENVRKTRVGLYRLEKDKLIICWSRGSAGKLQWPASLDPSTRISGSRCTRP